MDSTQKNARIAGLLYLIVVLTGIFSLAYIPAKLIVWDNAARTTTNILASEFLFRLSIVASVICYVAFLFLPMALYKLLHRVNKTYAIIMVVAAAVSVPISIVNLSNKCAVLTLIKQSDYLNVFVADKLQAQVLLQLNYYNNGIQLVSVFWGLWLFPFGYLVFKSAFLPKFLGVFLMAGCFGYLLNFTGNFLYPDYRQLGISSFIALPATIGEIGICLWLLIVGTKQQKVNS